MFLATFPRPYPCSRAKIYCALAHVLALIAAFSPVAEAADPPRHVFLIVIDTLRADHLRAYGYDRDTAPFIDSLAAEGVLYENAYAASSFTRESVAAMLTAEWPTASGTGAGWDAYPATQLETLPELFQRAGYATAFYADTPMLEHPGFARGFDEAVGMLEYGRSLLGGKVIARAKAFIEKNAGRNTFIYLHLLDPHSPYAPPAEYIARIGAKPTATIEVMEARANLNALKAEGFGPGDARFEGMVAAYDAEIAYQDDLLRGFADWLRETGRWDQTTIALTADHGEEFLDHGYLEHAWRLYVEVTHVPLIFWAGPGLQPARFAPRVSNVGIYPTLAALAAIPTRSGAFAVGPLLESRSNGWQPVAPPGPIISELQLPERNMVRTIIDGDSLYLAAQQWLSAERCADVGLHVIQRRLRDEFNAGIRSRPAPWGPVVHEELFDLSKDPRGLRDLAPAAPPQLARGRALLDDYRKQCEQKAAAR